MSRRITNNSSFILSFPIGGEAREHVKQLLNLNDAQSDYIDELPKYGTGIFRDRRFNRRYLLEVPGDLNVLPISRSETDQLMLRYIQKFHKEIHFVCLRAFEPQNSTTRFELNTDSRERYELFLCQDFLGKDVKSGL